MKKQVLFFIAGVFLTISVFASWAFKSKTDETAQGYAVVNCYNAFGIKANIAYPDGKTEKKKYSEGEYEAAYAHVLNDMQASGYTFVESNLQYEQGVMNGAILYFKKK